ncbi:ArsR/SmtB family transcription factor [Luteipulveratus mongoliensis]|uniref:HTH arsR-type domain-containing protein n=1 Tax=Luteipulveratus mongoliensis TaxID=571913 RepID=A0A0K1JPL7_9MICO|nr:metalloregulator ArsR/SmtB family transcription factor [Luteipulveratus mongoliensis]AKU18656.1 hypothetical protein VV02_05250 [Luteipulveratus mongoliensis]
MTTATQPSKAASDDACCSTASEGGLSEEAAEQVASLLKALADPVRLRLYSAIAARGEEVCVCDIPDVGVAQPTVSHHLRKLRDAGLVDCERRGTWVYYWAVPEALNAARDFMSGNAPGA